MRIRVRSRNPWRIATCAAAVGIRWVKPSKATEFPLFRFSATACLSGRNLTIASAPDSKKFALRTYVLYVILSTLGEGAESIRTTIRFRGGEMDEEAVSRDHVGSLERGLAVMEILAHHP